MPDSPKSVISRVSHGDASAFRELFQQFSGKVYGFALKLTHSQSTAEEVVQDVFLKVWTNRLSLESIDNFSAYLYAITKNRTFNILKRLAIEQKAKAEFMRNFRDSNSETEETIIYRDYQNILSGAIDRLSPQQKVVYGLCHGEGLKYQEAAERLQISRLTVKTHMQQAIRNIRSHLKHLVYFSGLLGLLGF